MAVVVAAEFEIPNRLFIRGITPDISEQELKDHLESEFGEVQSIHIISDGEGKYRGFGFVNFDSQKVAEKMAGITSKLKAATLFFTPAKKKVEKVRRPGDHLLTTGLVTHHPSTQSALSQALSSALPSNLLQPLTSTAAAAHLAAAGIASNSMMKTPLLQSIVPNMFSTASQAAAGGGAAGMLDMATVNQLIAEAHLKGLKQGLAQAATLNAGLGAMAAIPPASIAPSPLLQQLIGQSSFNNAIESSTRDSRSELKSSATSAYTTSYPAPGSYDMYYQQQSGYGPAKDESHHSSKATRDYRPY